MTDSIILPTPREKFNFQRSWNDLQRFPWIQAMVGVPQDPIHHGEGCVHTHTGMVIEELTKDPEWQSMTEPHQLMVYLAAVLHDVAKPLTTEYKDDGRIGHPAHSPKGALMARQILWDMDYPFAVREALLAHH